MKQENLTKIKNELEFQYLADAGLSDYVHSCYVSKLSLIKELKIGYFALKKNETIEDKCFVVLLNEMVPWIGAMPANEYNGYKVFYKVLKLKDLMQLS